MSITVETLATKRVVDTRTDVNSYSRRTYQIFDGPQDAGYVKFNPNGGNGTGSNQLNFTLNPPSTRVFVNRRVIIEAQFEVTLIGVPAAGQDYLLNYLGTGAVMAQDASPAASLGSINGNNGPRAYPLANATRSLQVSLNNDQLSQNLGQYWRATTRYANGLAQSEIDQGATATMLDLAQDYGQTNGNPLSPFSYRGANPLQTSRSSLYSIEIVDNPARDPLSPNAVLTAKLRFRVREPLYLSPFLFQRGEQDTGLIGIQTMNLQLQLGGRGGSQLDAAVYSCDKTETFSVALAAPVITATTLESFVYMNFLTPDALQIIPDINNYPYYEPTLYTTTNNEQVPAGTVRREIQMNNIQLNSIPQRLLIFIDEPDNAASAYKSDTYASIQGINISFDNRDSLLAAAQPIDLYNIAAKNNTNLTWTEWNRDCGSVLCLNFGEDIPLRANQAVGLRGSYNLRMTVTYNNIKTSGSTTAQGAYTQVPMEGATLSVVVFGVGVMTIAQQNVVRTVGILTNEDVLRSKMQPAVPYMPSGDLYGGGFFDDFAKGFMSVIRPVANIASKVLPFVAPEFAPIATGINSFINPQGSGLVGRGLVGGNVGGRMVGGKKVTRAQLAKMLK